MHRLGILSKSIWTTMFHPLISIFLVAVVAQVWLQMQKSPLRWCHPMWSYTHSAQDVLPLLSRLPDNWNRCSSGEWAWMSLWRWENKTSTVAILITLFECWQSSYFPGHNRHQYHNSAFNIKSLTWLQFYHTLMMLLHCSSLHLNCGFCNASIPGTRDILAPLWLLEVWMWLVLTSTVSTHTAPMTNYHSLLWVFISICLSSQCLTLSAIETFFCTMSLCFSPA